jgi:hypothetical protein
MADEDEELNWVAIIIAAVVVIGLVGGLVWYFLIREVSEKELNREPDYEVPESLVEESIYLDMPDMIISPSDSKGRYYLIVKFDVAMNDAGRARDEMIFKPWKWSKAAEFRYRRIQWILT